MWAQQYRDVMAKVQTAPLCLVLVEQTEGSAPRERGTWMAVFSDSEVGTIGGGHLELLALEQARELLSGSPNPSETDNGSGGVLRRFPLGPALGQCCGGVVLLRFTCFSTGSQSALAPYLQASTEALTLFGAGHVGHALIRLLTTLPYRLTWVDSRDAVFPQWDSWLVECEHSDPVQLAVPAMPAGSHVLIMSFSHAEDLEIVAQCLRRQRERGDLGYIGLIGSKTKWTTFSRRLRERGFTDAELGQVTCPIGVEGVIGKEPEVIAVAVAAQLLQKRRYQGNL